MSHSEDVADRIGTATGRGGSRIGRWARRALVPFVVLAALLGSAGPAGATLIASSGATGPSAVGRGSCEYLPVWGSLRTNVAPPAVYARNYRAGGGNDWQYVRYSVSLIDAASGTVLQRSGFSGTTVAWDNSPARFTGQTSFLANWRGNYRALFMIEWLDQSGRTILGRAYERVDSYTYYSNGVGPFSPGSTCAKSF